MKLILESTDTSMLLERSALLEARGIPTHLDEVAHVGVIPQHLYVLLEEHYADALALLEDESHRVSNPVSAEDLQTASDQVRQENRRAITRIFDLIAITCIVVLFLGFALAGVRNWLG
jgi:hypothetical protein